MTPGFQKCQSWPLENHLLTHELEKKKTVQIGLSTLKPNFSEIAFLGEVWSKYELKN
jgi:hypothetical protein